MSGKSQPEVMIRTATPGDAPACGQICYNAFSAINAAHGFPCDFPGPEVTTGLLSTMFSSPDFLLRSGGTGWPDHRQQLPG
jgi:hypothetical protein